jgi:hypothetical protein
VQEVEEVREAHKAAASAQMAGIAEMAQSATELEEVEIGTPRIKKEQLLRRRAGIKKDGYLLPGSNQGPC